jgi:dihydroneopterin aldolase
MDSNASITIHLEKLRFWAFHGLYPEEQKTGNEFEVDMTVSFFPPQQIITCLSESINYARLYELVKTGMLQREDLLETVAMKIAQLVKTEFPQVQEIHLKICKLHPPMNNFTGHVAVSFTKRF